MIHQSTINQEDNRCYIDSDMGDFSSVMREVDIVRMAIGMQY
jgi:hypothetical protein